MASVSTKIRPDVYEKFKEKAKELGTTVSDLVRSLIYAFLGIESSETKVKIPSWVEYQELKLKVLALEKMVENLRKRVERLETITVESDTLV